MNVFLKVAYDGTNYNGFQIQMNGLSIQEKIEDALYEIYKKDIKIRMASRTDTGVHAIGQCVTYNIEDVIIPLPKFPQVINRYLPEDIACNFIKIVDNSFHPRFHAKEKIYEYIIFNNKHPMPQYRNFSHYHKEQLNYEKMRLGAKKFLGTHDFASFSAKGSFTKNTVRTIYEIELYYEKPFIKFRIRGNGFLYNMVRIIAGTLIDIGMEKIEIEEIEKIILSKDRKKAGITASSQGLTLLEVIY